jgi:hypothetical protein
MATISGGDDINIEHDNHDDNVDLDGNDNDTGNATGTATTGGAPGGNGPTYFNLQVKQNKIPEFFGTKSKDTFSASDFIRRLEDLTRINRWNNATTLPMLSAIRHENGYPQWWTGTMMEPYNFCGQTSRIYSSKNTQSRPMRD